MLQRLIVAALFGGQRTERAVARGEVRIDGERGLERRACLTQLPTHQLDGAGCDEQHRIRGVLGACPVEGPTRLGERARSRLRQRERHQHLRVGVSRIRVRLQDRDRLARPVSRGQVGAEQRCRLCISRVDSEGMTQGVDRRRQIPRLALEVRELQQRDAACRGTAPRAPGRARAPPRVLPSRESPTICCSSASTPINRLGSSASV